MDVTVENHGSIVIVRPETKEARQWLKENTDGQWFGGGLAVEPRYVAGLLEGMTDAGFSGRIGLQVG